MKLTLYRDPTGFMHLQSEWNELLRRSRFETLFLSWEWQSHWWACLGAERGPLYLLAAHAEDRLVGILPLYQMQGALHVVGCVEVSDYLDFIIEVGQEEPVYRAFLDWLEGPNAPAWDAVDLCNQPATSLSHSLLPQLAQACGWQGMVTHEDVCPIVQLPANWDTYLESLDKKQRHEIRRKLRRMDREAPDYEVRYVERGAEVTAGMRDFIRLHRQSRSDKSEFMTPAMEAFFHSVAQLAAAAGWLRMAFLDISGRPAASYLCFTYGTDLLIYNSGYDPAAFPQLSPGWVLLAELIRHAIDDGRSRLDFLQGNEDYKYRFGGVDTPVYHTTLRR